MKTMYHGSSVKFEKFDLSHATEGDGKVKFGFGVYLTSAENTARHYAFQGAGKTAPKHYVYTVEVPDLTADNFIAFHHPVPEKLLAKAAKELGCEIPGKVVLDAGKDFRKFLAQTLFKKKHCRKPIAKAKEVENGQAAAESLESERLAAEFLLKMGVQFIVWPQAWPKTDAGKAQFDEYIDNCGGSNFPMNWAVLSDKLLKIINITEV